MKIAEDYIKQHSKWNIAWADAAEIDELNILNATMKCMRDAAAPLLVYYSNLTKTGFPADFLYYPDFAPVKLKSTHEDVFSKESVAGLIQLNHERAHISQVSGHVGRGHIRHEENKISTMDLLFFGIPEKRTEKKNVHQAVQKTCM